MLFHSFSYELCRIVSIVTVFVNKALLSGDTVKLDAPLFVTWIQCIISVVICLLLGLVKRSYLPNPKNVFSSNIIQTVRVQRNYYLRVLRIEIGERSILLLYFLCFFLFLCCSRHCQLQFCLHQWSQQIISAWNMYQSHFTTLDDRWQPFLMCYCRTHCWVKHQAFIVFRAVPSLLVAFYLVSIKKVWPVSNRRICCFFLLLFNKFIILSHRLFNRFIFAGGYSVWCIGIN